ncbi:hypothetical protein [Atrimonas thermophila]|uniref:hypothetical protein n=1 Tax=Atrimonas thermophila TaxID=3064161 RepID=UPI00399D0320
MKVYLYDKGYTSIITHSLKELVRECTRLDVTFNQLPHKAKKLDMFYHSHSRTKTAFPVM